MLKALLLRGFLILRSKRAVTSQIADCLAYTMAAYVSQPGAIDSLT